MRFMVFALCIGCMRGAGKRRDEMSGSVLARRGVLIGGAAGALLALAGCASIHHDLVTRSVRKLMRRSAENAFARLMAPDGFWDSSVARLQLPLLLGQRGGVVADILTSPAFKDRLQRAFNTFAATAARRAAPLVADAVEKIGIDNAKAILAGGPSAATAYLRAQMGDALLRAIVPGLEEAIRASKDPVLREAMAKLAGVDPGALLRQAAKQVDDAIWRQIGAEEAAIRADPAATRDPDLIELFGGK
jgi:hypothetical protein